MVTSVGDVEISFAVVRHAMRGREERGQRFAVFVSRLRPASDIDRARLDDAITRERGYCPAGDLDEPVGSLIRENNFALLIDDDALRREQLGGSCRTRSIDRAILSLVRLT